MNYSRIIATGSYLPDHILTNKDLEKMVETTDEWIMQRVGIANRHIAKSEQTNSYMAYQATIQALKRASLEACDLDMLIVATASPEKYFPSCACLLHNKLQLKTDIPAFDVNAACSGFIYALSIADQYIKSGAMQRILVVGVDALSRIVDWSDRSTCVLFGDGCGAVILERSDQPGILSTRLYANGEHGSMLYAQSPMWDDSQDYHLKMDGKGTFKVAVTKLGEVVERILADSELSQADIDWLIPHQANKRIIQAVAKKLKLPPEKVVITLRDHANTSAASIPLALDTAIQDGRIKPGHNILLEAFGAGFSWGAALVKY